MGLTGVQTSLLHVLRQLTCGPPQVGASDTASAIASWPPSWIAGMASTGAHEIPPGMQVQPGVGGDPSHGQESPR
jgi:hypothetical protein